MGGIRKITAGHYQYKGYEIVCLGYYPPDQKRVWEAVNMDTQCGDYHGYTLKEVKQQIDDDE